VTGAGIVLARREGTSAGPAEAFLGVELELESARRLLVEPTPANLAMLTAALEGARKHLSTVRELVAAGPLGEHERGLAGAKLRATVTRLERLALLVSQASSVVEARLAALRVEGGYRRDGSAAGIGCRRVSLEEHA
jgi:hypothetical protein